VQDEEPIALKTPGELALMRRAGRMVAELLEHLRQAVRPGVTTLALDKLAQQIIAMSGGRSAFKGYRGYPAHICTSVNEVVVHGIPSRRVLQEGDILGLDAGVVVEGYYADAAITVPVGRISPQAQHLLEVTQRALAQGIRAARAGRRLGDISYAIQREVEAHRCSVVREFVGHGIGTRLHEPPQVPNYGEPGSGPELKPGMVLAIEPMVTLGRPEVRILPDGWTAVTRDGSWSAHFEHTVAVTEGEPEVLTAFAPAGAAAR
jgi:methionyl aminopeptidase